MTETDGRTEGDETSDAKRAQMNLPALAVALLVVTTAAGLGFAMADRAFAGSDRDAETRRVAVALSERLLSADGPLTTRANVLSAEEIENLDGAELAKRFPSVSDHEVRVEVGDEVVATRGDPSGGVTIQRVVLVERREERTMAPQLSATNPAFTLPRRTSTAELSIRPPDGTTVTAVRANQRVVLRNASGVSGAFTLNLSRFDTARFAFTVNGTLPTGSVEVTYYPAEARKAVLAVTVDE